MTLIPEELLHEARNNAGELDDFGDASFRPGLDRLCKALNEEARLSEAGAGIMRQKLVAQLVDRLRVEAWFSQHPDIENESIAAPLVIVGLPRTGTTKLHRLLSCDARFYWMAFWESQFPVPFPGEEPDKPVERIREAHAMVDMMTQAMPQLAAMHPMQAEAADEEVMLMEHSFLSAFNAYANIPSYSAWLEQQDQRPAYRYLQRMLKFLQWQKRQRGIRAQRWVLKAPHHLLRMQVLLEVFPGAQVIQTHRDPTQSIPSLASFIHTLWGIYSDDADAHAAGRQWSELMNRALQHTMQAREALPAAFMDVQFLDTVKQPMQIAQHIYDFIGWPLDEATRARMAAWLKSDRQSHQGGHHYTTGQFGLSDAQIRRDFSAYCERHL